jgi:hypothetical protein
MLHLDDFCRFQDDCGILGETIAMQPQPKARHIN